MIKTAMIYLMVNANHKLRKKICYDLTKEMGLVFHINFCDVATMGHHP
jgi:hypothetical protein